MDVIVGLISFLISFFGGVIVSDNSHFKIKHYRIENKKIVGLQIKNNKTKKGITYGTI